VAATVLLQGWKEVIITWNYFDIIAISTLVMTHVLYKLTFLTDFLRKIH